MTTTDLTTEETWRLGEAVIASESGQGFSFLCRYVETLLADRANRARFAFAEEAAAHLRTRAEAAQGADFTSVTTGAHVADVAAAWIKELAEGGE